MAPADPAEIPCVDRHKRTQMLGKPCLKPAISPSVQIGCAGSRLPEKATLARGRHRLPIPLMQAGEPFHGAGLCPHAPQPNSPQVSCPPCACPAPAVQPPVDAATLLGPASRTTGPPDALARPVETCPASLRAYAACTCRNDRDSRRHGARVADLASSAGSPAPAAATALSVNR